MVVTARISHGSFHVMVNPDNYTIDKFELFFIVPIIYRKAFPPKHCLLFQIYFNNEIKANLYLIRAKV